MPTKPAWDELDTFLDPDDFGSVATITLKDGTVLTAVGLLDEPGLAAALGTFQQDTTRPVFTCKYADVSRVRRGDLFLIEGKEYDAHKSPHQDGHGLAAIELEPHLAIPGN
ncbi:hypothetical protein AWB77_06714 [Caballeronia fortuita]|uniref:Uncharacterized protein n=1 Tax=Caballeronia fortuita TaxID=1777138 RepID=A0A158E8U8_9BURK|nr:hypothetical protein [Caballeronia fortuita]SAL03130.1 hypothetical protein AWB77_06714 [Caballeronia fortuita]